LLSVAADANAVPSNFCSGKVRAPLIVIVFLLVCRSIREHVSFIVCHSRSAREKAFEDSAPGRCGVSSDQNECVLSQGSVIKQISESAFVLFFFFFFFFLTDCEAAVCSGGVYLVVMFQPVS
jgi:hypothetical protein